MAAPGAELKSLWSSKSRGAPCGSLLARGLARMPFPGSAPRKDLLAPQATAGRPSGTGACTPPVLVERLVRMRADSQAKFSDC